MQADDERCCEEVEQTGSEKQRAENEKQGTKKDEKQQQANAKDEPKESGKTTNDARDQKKIPSSKTATLDEKLDAIERWGLLPKRVVEKMRASSGKEYPAEYREIISRYYERLSEMYQESGAK